MEILTIVGIFAFHLNAIMPMRIKLRVSIMIYTQGNGGGILKYVTFFRNR